MTRRERRIVVGLGGPIGSGKSRVRDAFRILGEWETIDSDALAKELYFREEVRDAIIIRLGKDPVDHSGLLDKATIGLLLRDKKQKRVLEEIVHTALFEEIERMRNKKKGGVLLIESAILFTSGLYELCDQTISVTAPSEIRRQRVLERDRQKGPAFFDEMEGRQELEKSLLGRSDFFVHNYERHSIIKQVEQITKQIEQYARF